MKKILKWLGSFLTFFSICFIGYSVWNLGMDFSGISNIPLFILLLIAGVSIKIITVLITAFNWGEWVWFFAGNIGDRKEALRVYTKANIGKYLPGNVMHYVERNLFADKMGVPQRLVAASSIIDTISLIMVAVLVSLIVSFDRFLYAVNHVADMLGERAGIYIAAICFGGVICVIVLIFIIKQKVGSIIETYSVKGFLKRLIQSILWQTIALSLLGIILVFLYIYMTGAVGFMVSNVIISAYIISWVLGFVVIGAPGGIGVREMVLTLLLAPVIGQELILTLAVIHRLIMILGDFLTYLIGMIFFRGKEK